MKVIEFTNPEKWDQFIKENSSPASFLQSWQWGEFREKCLGEKVRYLAVVNDTQINTEENTVQPGLIATVLVIKKNLPFGKSYLDISRGPVVKQQTTNNTQQVLKSLINKIKEFAEPEKIIFVRITPPYKYKNVALTFRSNLGLIKPKILIHLKEPENTLVLNLEKSAEEILQKMHQKTRYNIKLAERKGVIVNYKQQVIDKDINIFYDLLQQTAKRDKIKIFSKSYYEKLLNYFGQTSGITCQMFTAEYNNQPLSSIIILGFADSATYLHGASSHEHRNLMPNHAVQWTAIKWVKEQGYKWYDFWGISHKKTKWSGITRFKQGFVGEKTGQEIHYLGTWDFILDKKWYNIFRFLKKLKI